MIVRLRNFKMIEIPTRKYNEFSFSDSVNIITGDNTKGKSTLIKAIMYCLGFNIIKWADKFSIEDFILKLEFIVDDQEHELIRHNNTFILDKDKIYLSEGEFKEAFNTLFDIKIKLNLRENAIRNGLVSTPYPTDTLLFSYIDQDSSYDSFFRGNHKSNQMYKNKEFYRVYNYLLEIEDYEIAELKNEKNKKQNQKTSLEKEQEGLKRLFKSIKKTSKIPIIKEDFEASFKILTDKLEELLVKKNELELEKSKAIQKIKGLEIEKINLENTYEQLENSNNELTCKFCQSKELEKTFTNNYKKELSKTAILQLYGKNKKETEKAMENLSEIDSRIEAFIDEINRVESEHSKAHSEMNINELLDMNANFKMNAELSKINQDIIDQIDNLSKSIKALEKEIGKKSSEIKSKNTEVKNSYRTILEEISETFNKSNFNDLKGKFMEFNINRAGVQNNIIHIVIYYIYLKLLNEYSKVKFPVVWDTFIKNTFDYDNISNLESFVNEKLLKLDNQIIISNIPTGRDVNVENSEEYNYIAIDDKICSKVNTEVEEEMAKYIFNMIKSKN